MAVPLADWAAAQIESRGSSVAWLTTIPEFEQCKEAWLAGVPPKLIRMWLTDTKDGPGYPKEKATQGRVDDYLRKTCPRD